MWKAEQALFQEMRPKPRKGAFTQEVLRQWGPWRVEGWSCHGLSSHSHSCPELAGEMSPNCWCVLLSCGHSVATQAYSGAAGSHGSNCTWLSSFGNWEVFSLLPGLGVYLPQSIEQELHVYKIPGPIISSCQGRRRSRHVISRRSCSFCPFLPSTKFPGQEGVEVGCSGWGDVWVFWASKI